MQVKIRIAAIILISAGYGWAGGHYIPANSPLIAYSFQFVVIAFLLIAGIKYLSATENERQQRNWSVIALSLFSTLSLVVNILNIIHGAYTTDPNSFGSHNTFADFVPIGFIILGTLLWISTMFRKAK
ncbi:MAG: hypothetical protein ABI358_04190 [Ginsengibacter sp.]